MRAPVNANRRNWNRFPLFYCRKRLEVNLLDIALQLGWVLIQRWRSYPAVEREQNPIEQ